METTVLLPYQFFSLQLMAASRLHLFVHSLQQGPHAVVRRVLAAAAYFCQDRFVHLKDFLFGEIVFFRFII